MRPRGSPPTPSARSSDRAPVGIAATETANVSSPIFMIEPAPNWRSICVSAPWSAESRALAAFSCSLSISGFSLMCERSKVEVEPDGCSPPQSGYQGQMASLFELVFAGPRLFVGALEAVAKLPREMEALRGEIAGVRDGGGGGI